VLECKQELYTGRSFSTLEPVEMHKPAASGETESYRSISERGECREFKGEDEDDQDVSESEFFHALLHPFPESPNR